IWGLRTGLGEAAAVTLLSALVIGGAVAPLPLGWLADHVDRRLLLILCGVVTLAAALALPLVAPSPWAMSVVLLVWGGAGGGLYTLAIVRLGEVFRPDQLGAATAAYVMMTHIGSIAGPILLGGGMDLAGPSGFVAVTAGGALVFVLFAAFRYVLRPQASRAA
ncbi:MAG: MFS transporter, partial [Alphaproteobacteria bacterium]